MRSESTIYRPRVRPQSVRRIALRRAALLAASFLLLASLVGLAFAGSSARLAGGTSIAGVAVGGMTTNEATALLSSRAAEVARVPITFTVAGKRVALSASQLGVEADWRAAVETARAAGGGFGPVRGYRRLFARLSGENISPPVTGYREAIDYKLGQLALGVDVKSVDARLVRKGLSFNVVEGRNGRQLDRAAARATIERALAGFERGATVTLPASVAPPRVSGSDLADAAAQARVAVSAPVRLAYGETRWLMPRWRIATLLQLPAGGTTKVSIAGRPAEKYIEQLSKTVSRPPQDARFQLTAAGKIVIKPSVPGLVLDIPGTAKAIASAAFTTESRFADLVVRVAQPERTTAVAKTMGIEGVVASYSTTYGGTPGRLHNVQLVSQLIDGTLIEPGGTFSFNDTTGERTAAKGFQEAPVIISGELRNGLGGGVCQVSTTVFNAAYDAGLPITSRTNHALYIDHYPLGRDATVDYPYLDLRFSNDTGHWLLLRTFVGEGSLTVNLYGTPLDRRVESTTQPLVTTGPVPVEEIADPELLKGKRVIDEVGSPPRQTSVQRLVYGSDGKLLYDNTWRSYYVGEPTVVRVGTKNPPEKPAAAKAKTPGAVAGPTGPPSAGPPSVVQPPADGALGPTAPAAPPAAPGVDAR